MQGEEGLTNGNWEAHHGIKLVDDCFGPSPSACPLDIKAYLHCREKKCPYRKEYVS